MFQYQAAAIPYSLFPTPYSLLAVGVPDLGLLIVKVLAVVGGVAVGAAGCGLFFKLMARLVLRQKKVPRPILAATRVLGGIAVGLLVWAWVFNPGGQGGMGGSGGGWWPFGQGGGKGNAVAPKPADRQPSPKESEPAPEPRAGGTALQITMLGGARVREQRFYVLDQETPRNWDELRRTIAERKSQNPDLRDIDVIIYKDSVDRDNPAVTELARWAKENGFTPRVSFLDRDLP